MNDKPDLSTLIAMMKNGGTDIKPEELLSNLINSSSTNGSSTANTDNPSSKSNPSSANEPDMEMMMKLMQIMKSSNQDTPSKDLLRSLKPFLNDSRKEKVDQYIKILGMAKALELFNGLGDNLK